MPLNSLNRLVLEDEGVCNPNKSRITSTCPDLSKTHITRLSITGDRLFTIYCEENPLLDIDVDRLPVTLEYFESYHLKLPKGFIQKLLKKYPNITTQRFDPQDDSIE